ncbi:hypothetical protein EV421DRAFT_940192 [Armillaria borealis]|uniref:Ras-binding domain-containing protein n=1 Tax=Armillaria borealis TaxID=47425 RepID=A0AA39J9R6_9AGAR|nr:hypothetical protein EV421DRAFT_940192 [Armillaria borealis]
MCSWHIRGDQIHHHSLHLHHRLLLCRVRRRLRIIVTSNAERYQVVEITGATNGSSIRERILSKLCIPDDRYSRFRVYQAQVGTYAIGSALSDAMLFEICLQQGDPSGSLTFFVSTAPDRPPKTTEPDYSDTYLYSQSRRRG